MNDPKPTATPAFVPPTIPAAESAEAAAEEKADEATDAAGDRVVDYTMTHDVQERYPPGTVQYRTRLAVEQIDTRVSTIAATSELGTWSPWCDDLWTALGTRPAPPATELADPIAQTPSPPIVANPVTDVDDVS